VDREIYSGPATITVGNTAIPDVPCRVHVPERITDKPRMAFRPTKEQYDQLKYAPTGSVKAELTRPDGTPTLDIRAPVVHFEKMNELYWGQGRSDCSFEGAPQDLSVTRHFGSTDDRTPTSLVLWLSPNAMLTPLLGEVTSYDGSITMERNHCFALTLNSGPLVTFDRHFGTRRDSTHEMTRWSFLVARADVSLPAHETEAIRAAILQELDDFLLVASLGSRTRTACLGWRAIDGRTDTTYYRGHLVFPTGTNELSFDVGLVRRDYVEEFLTHCHATFCAHGNRDVLRQAVWSLVPNHDRLLEDSFLSMFAALEGLLLDYRRRTDLEFVLDAVTWRAVRSAVHVAIKGVLPDRDRRRLIYPKVEELNRISLRDTLQHFCHSSSCDLSDLWPIFPSDGMVGLSDLRNLLVHGDPVAASFPVELLTARESLRWSLERVLTNMLEWPIDRTEVDPQYLRWHARALRSMVHERARISSALSAG
jgi:hypothetical protein